MYIFIVRGLIWFFFHQQDKCHRWSWNFVFSGHLRSFSDFDLCSSNGNFLNNACNNWSNFVFFTVVFVCFSWDTWYSMTLIGIFVIILLLLLEMKHTMVSIFIFISGYSKIKLIIWFTLIIQVKYIHFQSTNIEMLFYRYSQHSYIFMTLKKLKKEH